MDGMTYVHSIKTGLIEPHPLSKKLNLTINSFTKGNVYCSATITNEFASKRGVLLGGITSMILDMAMGLSLVSCLGDNIGTYTIEMKINFFKTIRVSLNTIQITGTVLHCGKTLGHTEACILDSNQTLYAKALGTFIILPDEKIDGLAGIK
ncbi:MAG: PaaI family thioesterase [Methylacidiphilales bacterium]|nr:PaaI family thioesterase [Candidatus Methylacidiphilales bacterium]